jgi:hypothetical protein
MTMSAISHYRGGTIDVVAPLAKIMKAVLLKHGATYRLSRFETGPNIGDWLVVVQYADSAAYGKAVGKFCPRSRIPAGWHRDCKDRSRISRSETGC